MRWADDTYSRDSTEDLDLSMTSPTHPSSPFARFHAGFAPSVLVELSQTYGRHARQYAQPTVSRKRQYELGVDFYFIRITSITDKMISVLRTHLDAFARNPPPPDRSVDSLGHSNSMRPSLQGTSRCSPKFIEFRLDSYDNPFVAAVVESMNESAGLNLRYEDYC